MSLVTARTTMLDNVKGLANVKILLKYQNISRHFFEDDTTFEKIYLLIDLKFLSAPSLV